jgi:ribosomal protein S18 acetylase RimI-like enzyme
VGELGVGHKVMIEYRTSLEGISNDELNGFFVDWPEPPSAGKLREILERSYAFIIAFDTNQRTVIGFVTAISDGIFAAFIPLIEVKPEYQRMGIGKEMLRRVETRLASMYSIDLVCDSHLDRFYEGLGYTRVSGYVKRNRGRTI